MKKIIFITGGVVSSLGKGLITASISALLKSMGYTILTKKIDPYFNYDSGTLSPYEHGEVFVTVDGGETDLDLGHYERFSCEKLKKNSSITAGRVYYNILIRERKGDYGGKTVQIIPHITEEISKLILETNKKKCDFVIVELGGTVGDLELEVFLETIMHIRSLQDKTKTMIFHTALLPTINLNQEIKTKPTQHSVKQLHLKGVHPDAIILRPKSIVDIKSKEVQKISYLTGVKQKNIFISYNVQNIYTLPLVFFKQGILNAINEKFNLKPKKPNLLYLKKFEDLIEKRKGSYKIGIVGKYIGLKDSYLSIIESLYIASAYIGKKIKIEYIDSEYITNQNINNQLEKLDGIIVAPGFGKRGIKGKLLTCKYARENSTPLLGICFGMQIAVIEFLKNVCNVNTTSKEFTSKKNSKFSITLLKGRNPKNKIGGTLRLGNYKCHIKKNTKTYSLYKKNYIYERHRHRYEVNSEYVNIFEKHGMIVSGKHDILDLVEIIEIKNHKFFVGCQFHPEYNSNIKNPHPLFLGLLNSI